MTGTLLSEKVVMERVAWIRGMLAAIQRLPLESYESFLSDDLHVAAAESYLRRALEALMDLGRHMLAKGFGMVASEYREIPRQLQEAGVQPVELAARMGKLAGYRNRMVHFYHEVSDKELIRMTARNDMDERLMKWFVRFAIASALLMVAVEAHGQSVGFSGGVAVDPSQVYIGTHVELPELANRIYLRPGIDGAFGSLVKEAIVDVAFMYRFPLGDLSRWAIYQGTGPVVTIERAQDEVRVHGGFGAVFGFANRNGFFVEFKVSGGGGPNLRLGIGYTLRRHRP